METSNLEVSVKKLLLIGSSAIALALALVATPDARGAPAGSTKPSMENAVIVAQLVPAVVQQDLAVSMPDEIVIALCAKALPMEIIGIARSCDDVQEVVVAGTEKVGVVRIARQTVGEAGPAVFTEMLGAVRSAHRPFVQRV